MMKGKTRVILIIIISVVTSIVYYAWPEKIIDHSSKTGTIDTIPEPTIKYGIHIDSFTVYQKNIKHNEFLANILLNYNIPYGKIDELAKTSKPIFDVRKIAANHKYTVLCEKDSTKKAAYFI